MDWIKTLFGLSLLIFGLNFAVYATSDNGGFTKIDEKIGKGKAERGKTNPCNWNISKSFESVSSFWRKSGIPRYSHE